MLEAMKFAIQINTGPFSRQATESAYYFTSAAIQAGHEIHRVFFYHDGVYNANDYALPPRDDRNPQQLWIDLAHQHQLDMVICVTSAMRRGIVSDQQSSSGLSANLAEPYQISGLGQLIEAAMIVDRLIIFGG